MEEGSPSLEFLCAGKFKGMKKTPLKPSIYYRIFEDLPGYFALLDEHGNILETNTFWQKEAILKGLIIRPDCIGYNYLKLCENAKGEEKEFAEKIKKGILLVLKKKLPFFSLIYELSEKNQKFFKKFLFLFYPLKTRPKVFALLHQELPKTETFLPLLEPSEEKIPTPSFSTRWFSFLEGLLFPFLTLLQNKLDPELENMRLETLNKLKELKKEAMASLNPLAMLNTKEAQIALLVKEGKTSEEIAKILNLGKDAVDFYRKRIREKLGLKGKDISLKEYLQKFIS